jgi:hypothetical protein
MWRQLALVLSTGGLLCLAQVHEPLPQRSDAPRDGGERGVLESIVIPPIPHAPFSATLATEAVKYSSDGVEMSFVNQRRIARDKHGRVYQERWYLVPKNSKVTSTMNWIQLADPDRHTLYNCSTQKHICDLLVYTPDLELAAAKAQKGSSHKLPDDGGEVVWEDLGTRSLAGVETAGSRETTTTAPGTMGNDRALTSVREFWHSDQLGINLLSILSSPFSGKQTFSIIELTTAEPDPRLFDIPEGYTIDDQRKQPRISE